jgi:hypothetical protein
MGTVRASFPLVKYRRAEAHSKVIEFKIERLIFRDVGIVHAMIGLRRDGITL